MKCKYCTKEITNGQTRNLLPHSIACTAMPSAEKTKWTAVSKRKEREKELKILMKTAVAARTPAKQRRVGNKTPTPTIIRQLFPGSGKSPRNLFQTPKNKMSREERQLAIAKAIIANGLSFRIVEDKFFMAMFDDEEDIPSRFQVAGALVEKIYKTERAKVVKTLASVKFVCVVTDGWSSRRNESVINFVLVNPFIKPLFWKSFATGESVHDGAYIAKQIAAVIDEVDGLVGRKIVRAVVTDNAKNMKNAWQRLEQSPRGLICNGCAAHVMNLLMKDVFKLEYFSWVLEHAKTLTNFIKGRHALLDRFRSMQKSLKAPTERRRALSLPVATCWYTCESCILSVVSNRNVITTTFADDELLQRYQRGEALSEARAIVANEQFWQRAPMVLKVVKPIDQCLAAFEKDNCSISMINHLFIWLDEVFKKPAEPGESALVEQVRTMTLDRKAFLFTPSMKAAYLLDQSKPLPANGSETMATIRSTVELAERVGLPDGASTSDVHNELSAYARANLNWTIDEKEGSLCVHASRLVVTDDRLSCRSRHRDARSQRANIFSGK